MGKTKQERAATKFKADAVVTEESLAGLFSKRVHDAVFLGETLSFDWHLEDDTKETVNLTKLEGTDYAGTSIRQAGIQREASTKVQAVLYKNSKGRILLADAIYDDGSEESWIIRFYKEEAESSLV